MASKKTPVKANRSDNRKPEILDTAARLFSEKGYHAVSMRDIAKETGMLPGSLYYHFSSKENLLYSVYERGVNVIAAQVDAATASQDDPWDKLAAACSTHLEELLGKNAYAQVVTRILPQDVASIRKELSILRDGYENRFKDLIAALGLDDDVDQMYLRLLLLGALNSTLSWYNKKSGSPSDISSELIKIVGQRIKS